jgi:hypothetical protein
MTHDPLCELSKACDDETPEHGYFGIADPNYCMQCHTWCVCGEIRQAEQRMLAKCIAAVEEMPGRYKHRLTAGDDEYHDGWHECEDTVLAALRGLQEQA